MANKYDDSEGVWRTIGGRRVFIRTGQSLSDAMKESGKFKGMSKAAVESSIKANNDDKKVKKALDELNEKTSKKDAISERDAKDLIKQLNDEGSDFTFNEDVVIKDGKLITDVGVMMPTEDGYTSRELQIPLDDNETYASLEEKLRDWEDRHRSVDDWENADFDAKEIDTKSVMDSDGFMTDYTLYEMPNGKYKAVFGDKEVYGADADADMEFDNLKEAQDWFKDYKGFDEEDNPMLKYSKDIMVKDANGKEVNAYDNIYDMDRKQAQKYVQDLNNQGQLSKEDYDALKDFVGFEDEKTKANWLSDKDQLWLYNQGHQAKLNEKIANFNPSGDVENDARRLNDIATNYFYDEVGVYNENIDSIATKWANDKANVLNGKATNFETFDGERDLKIGDTYIDGSGDLRKVIDKPAEEGRLERKLAKAFMPGQENIKGTKWETEKLRVATDEDYATYPSIRNANASGAYTQKVAYNNDLKDLYNAKGTSNYDSKFNAMMKKYDEPEWKVNAKLDDYSNTNFKQWMKDNNVDYDDYTDFVDKRSTLNPDKYEHYSDYDKALKDEYLKHHRNAKSSNDYGEWVDNNIEDLKSSYIKDTKKPPFVNGKATYEFDAYNQEKFNAGKTTNDTMNNAIREKASKKVDYSKYNDKATANFGKIDYYGNGRKSNAVGIEMELKDGTFSASGFIKNAKGTDWVSGGQNIDEIADMMKDNKDVQEIRDLWHKYHLNDMHAGTEKQEEALQKKFGGVNANKYDEQVDYLKSIGLYEDNGYKFGTGWLKREIPDEDKERIVKLIDKYNGKTDETMNDIIRKKASKKK